MMDADYKARSPILDDLEDASMSMPLDQANMGGNIIDMAAAFSDASTTLTMQENLQAQPSRIASFCNFVKKLFPPAKFVLHVAGMTAQAL